MSDRDDVEQITEFCRDWCDFGEERAYILMAIARRKFNEGVTNSTEVVHRRILTEAEDVERNVADLLALLGRHDLHFRVYLTVNARNVVSAYYSFTQELVQYSADLHYGDDAVREKMALLNSEWKSTLHKPAHRDDELFLFDYDGITGTELASVIDSLDEQTFVHRTRETPNGFHVVTDPFRYTQWESPVEYDEMDTDGMVHVAELDLRGTADTRR